MSVNPKEKYIQETKSLTKASRDMYKPQEVSICGLELTVFPHVFNPGIFFSSGWFAKTVSKYVQEVQAQLFCEVGSGTGIVSIIVAKENKNIKVTACDINPEAVQNTKQNAERATVQINTLQSDVFSNISHTFDVIFWALPFGYLEANEKIDMVDMQTFDPGYQAIEAFFKNGAAHLNPRGALLFGFSPEIGHMELIANFAEQYKWELTVLAEENGTEKSKVRMQVFKAKPKIKSP